MTHVVSGTAYVFALGYFLALETSRGNTPRPIYTVFGLVLVLGPVSWSQSYWLGPVTVLNRVGR